MFLAEIVETGDKYRGVTGKRCEAFPEGPEKMDISWNYTELNFRIHVDQVKCNPASDGW